HTVEAGGVPERCGAPHGGLRGRPARGRAAGRAGLRLRAGESRLLENRAVNTGETVRNLRYLRGIQVSVGRTARLNPPYREAAYNRPMLIKQAPDVRSSEITPKSVYLLSREFIQAS